VNRQTRLFPKVERRIAMEVLLAGSIALVLLARVDGLAGLKMAALGLLVAAGLLLVVKGPDGPVPLGYALLIAVAGLASASTYFVVAAFALLAAAPTLVSRHGRAGAVRRLVVWLSASVAAGSAAAAARFVAPGDSAMWILAYTVVAGVAFLGTDFFARNWRAAPGSEPTSLRRAAPVYLSILCAAGLTAVAYLHGQELLSLVALLPLILTKFAFDRYAAADEAYQQTIKALSIVPEVAGVTPFGHGERSAAYAVALARRLGLPDDATDRVATAARLHHIGYVTLDDPLEAMENRDRDYLSRLGGDILRETQFLADIGGLVETVDAEQVQPMTREAAVLRVASAFDHLVLENPGRAEGAVQLLASQQSDPYGSAAVLALRWLIEEDPAFLERSIASGRPLTDAAAASTVAHG